jgi:pilus assembly protein CpaE
MSGGGRRPAQNQGEDVISIILVDDIPEASENIKKLLAFESDFKVVGTALTGREGVQLAKDVQPDVIIMDINMPDMDGLQATSIINKQVPTAAVIIMSVQNDADYMRRALRAGARDFLAKPVNMDDLYSTIRTVYRNHEPVRRQYAALEQGVIENLRRGMSGDDEMDGDRAGHVLAVYSPQGGSGTTTLATSLASGLMKEGIKVLLIDADLQFADVATFLNLQSQTSVVEVAQDVDDLDVDLFENIVVTHDSGLKVLLGPPRPEEADAVSARGQDVVARIVDQVRPLYDFVVVDMAKQLDESALALFERSTKIVMTGTPTLVSIKNLRLVLDIFDKLEYDKSKTVIVVNKTMEDRRGKTPTVPAEKIQSYLKQPVIGQIPLVDERIFLSAINKGVPVVASDRNQDRPPIKQFLEVADYFYNNLMTDGEDDDEQEDKPKRRGGIASLLGR